MANTVTFGPLNTSNPFIKFQLIVTEKDNGKFKIEVEAWRTNSGYTTSRNCECRVRAKTDASESATKIWPTDSSYDSETWDAGEKPVRQYSYTSLYSKDDIVIPVTGLSSIYIDACILFYGSPEYTSSYQGGTIELGETGAPEAYIIPNAVGTNTVSLTVVASEECDEWWYTVRNGDNTEDVIGWTQFSSTEATSQSVQITGLQSNTQYYIRCDVRSVATDLYCSSKPNYKTRTTQNISDTNTRITLFDVATTDFQTNGLGSLPDVVSCMVTEERNGIFELEMEYPITGRKYELLSHNRILLAKPNPYAKPQPFRIYGITRPYNHVVTVYAQHISYDLSFYVASKFSAKGAADALNKMNLAIDGGCPFEFWTDMVASSSDRTIETHKPLSVKSILGGEEDSILENFHGEYEFDGFHVKLWNHRGSDNVARIRYGKNLTDVKQEENCSNMCTAVRPYWYKEETVDNNKKFTLVELPADHITVEGQTIETPNHTIQLIQNAALPRVLLLDFSSEFDDKPEPVDLLVPTYNYITENNLIFPQVSINVSFVSLENTDEYEDIKDLQRVRLCDSVIVEFPKLGLVVHAVQCVKTVYNVLTQQYDSIELGSIQTYLSGTISTQSKDIQNSVTKNEFAEAMAKT